MAQNKSRAVRKREIIDAVFVFNRGGTQPTIRDVARIIGMKNSPQLIRLFQELVHAEILYFKQVHHRKNSLKNCYAVNMLGLKDADPIHYEKIRCHWPTMFPDGELS